MAIPFRPVCGLDGTLALSGLSQRVSFSESRLMMQSIGRTIGHQQRNYSQLYGIALLQIQSTVQPFSSEKCTQWPLFNFFLEATCSKGFVNFLVFMYGGSPVFQADRSPVLERLAILQK